MSVGSRSALRRYGIAAGAAGAAVSLKYLLDPVAGADTPFLLLFAPVAIAAWWGGLRPALVTVGLLSFAVWWIFLPPVGALSFQPRILSRVALFLVEAGFVAGFLLWLKNTRTRAERAEEQLAATLASIGDGVIATDERGRVQFMNTVAERLTGWSQAEARGQAQERVFRVVDEQSHRPVESTVGHVIRHQKIIGLANNVALIAKDGTARGIEDSGAPIRDRSGRLRGAVMVFRDVSAPRRAERRRRFLADATTVLLGSLDFESTLQRVASLAVPDLADFCIVYLVDEQGGLAPLAVAHMDPEQLARMRKMLWHYLPQADKDVPLFEAVLTRQTQPVDISDEVLVAIAQNQEQLATLRSFGMRSALMVPLVARERTQGVIALVSTTTGHRFESVDVAMAEDLARRAAVAVDNARLYAQTQEAVQARDEFLSIASHELRTPLTPLQLQLDNLERGLDSHSFDRERFRKRLRLAARQTRRLTDLVDGLLDVSRVSAGGMTLHPEELDLVDVAQGVLKRFEEEAQRASTPLHFSADEPVRGRWDRLRIEQMVSSLLSNALKYGAGHPIEVTVEGTTDIARLSVRDQGIGIPPQDMDRIFGRFARATSVRHYGGLGLGLFISRQIAEAHGGTIVAQSQPGRGATFTIILPRELHMTSTPTLATLPPR